MRYSNDNDLFGISFCHRIDHIDHRNFSFDQVHTLNQEIHPDIFDQEIVCYIFCQEMGPGYTFDPQMIPCYTFDQATDLRYVFSQETILYFF
jgi:hypothetical protein